MNHTDPVLVGIATSGWSQAQRIALIMVLDGSAFELEHFVPHPWNRLAKARAALRELEKAGHLVRDGGRLLLIESSFTAPASSPPAQLHLLQEPGLGTALAEIARVPAGPVPDRTDGPSQDGRPVLSGTGRDERPSGAGVFAPSCLGPPRSSNRIEQRSSDFDDRGRPSPDTHQEHIFERLAKTPSLRPLREELLRRKSPTATRFWRLFDTKPGRAAELIESLREARKPAAYLNRALQREVIA